jgi:hypothetical protein
MKKEEYDEILRKRAERKDPKKKKQKKGLLKLAEQI